jgi:phytoene synthase
MSIATAQAPGIDLAACQEHVRAVVAGSGTSFYWGMRMLPLPKREAMFAIYAFCREVDDIADSDAPGAAKQADLARWREEIEALYAGRPSRPTSLALAAPIERFDLPRAEFDAMIDGMEMDAIAAMRAPPMAQLERYCRCVAGAVGVLSVHVFGARAPDRVAGAVALGEALQLTNILSDLPEDADFGRSYLPRELLASHGIASAQPDEVLGDPALPAVCREFASRAAGRWFFGFSMISTTRSPSTRATPKRSGSSTSFRRIMAPDGSARKFPIAGASASWKMLSPRMTTMGSPPAKYFASERASAMPPSPSW